MVRNRGHDINDRRIVLAEDLFVIACFLIGNHEVHPIRTTLGVIGVTAVFEIGTVVSTGNRHVEAFHIEEGVSFTPKLDTLLEDYLFNVVTLDRAVGAITVCFL